MPPRNESRLWTKTVEMDPARNLRLSLVEDPTIDVGGDEAWCAWCLWPAGRVLTAYLASLEDDALKDQSVLELGSGCGAVGMYLGLRGASPVVLTDVYRALPLLKRNVTANGLGSRCEISALPWGTPLERLAPAIRSRAPFDLVVASDCTYDFALTAGWPSPSMDNLLATARCCSKKALICVSRRVNEIEAFHAALDRAGLTQLAKVVHTAAVDVVKEGVSECMVYAFDFAGSSLASPACPDAGPV
ncbi:unnamed protein product [Polarella glacialis]|uniref:Calmodulin-lysine N-methyltransferase n=1 Tax=Polarella glacialis TaxID=89957 RepID=A0A813G6H3_POLGL|nr:unnamed protein product [Polarella glacialis]